MPKTKPKSARWRVMKLSGATEGYEEAKVVDAIFLAAQEAGGTDEEKAKSLGRT